MLLEIQSENHIGVIREVITLRQQTPRSQKRRRLKEQRVTEVKIPVQDQALGFDGEGWFQNSMQLSLMLLRSKYLDMVLSFRKTILIP